MRIRWTVFVYISKLFVVKKIFYSWNFGSGMNNLVLLFFCRIHKLRLLSLAKHDVIVVMLWFLVSCTLLVIYDSSNMFFYESSTYLSLIPRSTEGTIFWLVFWKMVLVKWEQVLHSCALVSLSTDQEIFSLPIYVLQYLLLVFFLLSLTSYVVMLSEVPLCAMFYKVCDCILSYFFSHYTIGLSFIL